MLPKYTYKVLVFRQLNEAEIFWAKMGMACKKPVTLP